MHVYDISEYDDANSARYVLFNQVVPGDVSTLSELGHRHATDNTERLKFQLRRAKEKVHLQRFTRKWGPSERPIEAKSHIRISVALKNKANTVDVIDMPTHYTTKDGR